MCLVWLMLALSPARARDPGSPLSPPAAWKGYEFTFLLRRPGEQDMVMNPARAKKSFSPCSTFKIPNSLIALEVGAVRDEEEVVRWDGRRRRYPDWNKDHCMRTAMATSCLPFFQELARRIGAPRYREFLQRLSYGNRDISGGLTEFWLTSSLRISPCQQLELIDNLVGGRVPFSPRSQRIVRSILLRQSENGWRLSGKTGSGYLPDGRVLGWFVGWVEGPAGTCLFVANLEGPDRPGLLPGKLALEGSLEQLRQLGWWPQ